MSRLLDRAVVTLALAALGGCVSPPQPKQVPPDGAATNGSLVSDARPTSAQKYAATDLEGTYFGASGATGSLGVGLLLGPLGVAANVAYINSKNQEMARPLAPLTSQDLGAVLRREVPALADPGGRAPGAFRLTPAAQLFFTSDTTYRLTCTVTVELPQAAGAPPWAARYGVNVEGTFDSAAAGDTARATSALGPCLRDAHALFAEHVSGKLGAFETRTLTRRAFNGNGTFDQQVTVAVSGLPSKVLINDFLGVMQVHPGDVVRIK